MNKQSSTRQRQMGSQATASSRLRRPFQKTYSTPLHSEEYERRKDERIRCDLNLGRVFSALTFISYFVAMGYNLLWHYESVGEPLVSFLHRFVASVHVILWLKMLVTLGRVLVTLVKMPMSMLYEVRAIVDTLKMDMYIELFFSSFVHFVVIPDYFSQLKEIRPVDIALGHAMSHWMSTFYAVRLIMTGSTIAFAGGFWRKSTSKLYRTAKTKYFLKDVGAEIIVTQNGSKSEGILKKADSLTPIDLTKKVSFDPTTKEFIEPQEEATISVQTEPSAPSIFEDPPPSFVTRDEDLASMAPGSTFAPPEKAAPLPGFSQMYAKRSPCLSPSHPRLPSPSRSPSRSRSLTRSASPRHTSSSSPGDEKSSQSRKSEKSRSIRSRNSDLWNSDTTSFGFVRPKSPEIEDSLSPSSIIEDAQIAEDAGPTLSPNWLQQGTRRAAAGVFSPHKSRSPPGVSPRRFEHESLPTGGGVCSPDKSSISPRVSPSRPMTGPHPAADGVSSPYESSSSYDALAKVSSPVVLDSDPFGFNLSSTESTMAQGPFESTSGSMPKKSPTSPVTVEPTTEPSVTTQPRKDHEDTFKATNEDDETLDGSDVDDDDDDVDDDDLEVDQ